MGNGGCHKPAGQGRSPWGLLREEAGKRPHLILPGLIALLNGYWHRVKFFLSGKNVRIGRAFRVYGTFRVMGPGRVVIGDNCFVQSKLFGTVSFMTVLSEACIEVGNNVGFSGTVIQCFERISIGDWCNIANAYIVDSPAHHLSADRRHRPVASVPRAPGTIHENVWVSARVVITHGVEIGRNSVIGACSLVRGYVPPDTFFAGIPARFIKPIPPSDDRAPSSATGEQCDAGEQSGQ
jgi:acetyltransferase-like isoleucine patch superfamily enzyme